MAFNPNEHMMKLKGKDYLQVAWRLVWFREDHPDWPLDTSIIEMDADHAVFKAIICDENGAQKSAGHGSESKRDFGDYIEKAETKAIGRALAMLGYGTQFAADELDEGDRIVDSHINRGKVQAEPLPDDALKPGEHMDLPPAGSWNPMNAIGLYCKRMGLKMADFGNMRNALVAGGVVKDIPSKELKPDDFDELCKAMEANYPDALRKTA